MKKLTRNAAQCVKCGLVIESTYTHDFVACACGAIAVDGGLDYVARTGYPSDMNELCEWQEVPDKATPELTDDEMRETLAWLREIRTTNTLVE